MIGLSDTDVMEKQYQSLYKPLGKFLYAHQSFRLSFSFNGIQLSFFEKKHPEFIEILRELVVRKQIEMIGGGFYDPVFPLLYPIDRSGQIDLLSSKIRHLFGTRPRGISLCASIWDPCLVSSFTSSGMEYVILDESLIQEEKRKYVPLLMADKGKSISVLSDCVSLKPDFENAPSKFIEEVRESIRKSEKHLKNEYFDSEKVVCIQLKAEEMECLLKSNWLNNFSKEMVSQKDEIELCTCFQFVKNTECRIPAYISSGMSSEIATWAIKPYQSVKKSGRWDVTIFDLFQVYPQSKALFDRMVYVSQLVNLCHGDKVRKNLAREKLWESQIGNSFICTSKGAFVTSSFRQQAYKNLFHVEKILRECSDFSESVCNFDYNADGYDEYVCRMENFFAVLNRRGGAIREFDVMQDSGNFADNLARIKEFEGCDDNYERGLFIDHLWSEKEFENYVQNNPSGGGIFSQKLYNVSKFNASRKEVNFTVSAVYNNKQKVNIRKKYIANSNGFSIQYILKNESDSMLNAKFVVESSFAQVNFKQTNFNAFKLAIVTDGQKQEIDTKFSSKLLIDSGCLSEVEAFQLTDTENGILFNFEPNEACGLSFVPIIFKRPEYVSGKPVDASMTFAASLYWDVQLPGGMEMEKNINFSFCPERKKKKRIK